MKRKIDPLTRELSLFAMPMLIGNILQSCYSMVDMAVVGQFVGRDALAAVSNASMISFISGSLCMGFTIGGTVLVAKYRGACEIDAQRDVIRTLFALSLIGGVLLTVVNYLLYQPILHLINTPGDALPYAIEYLSIVCAGNLFIFGYNAISSVMRGLGDSRRPLYFVAITATVNIVLDYLFVGFFHWGIKGAAIATVIAQAASCLAAIWTLHRYGKRDDSFVFHFDRQSLRMNGELCRSLLRIGMPTALHSAALNVSYLIVTALFNGFGTAAAAAAGIGLKVNTFVAMPSWAAGQAVSAMAGYSMGAEDPKRAVKIAKRGILLSLLLTGVFLCFMQVFIHSFVGLFTSDMRVIELGVLYLRICCSVNFIPYVAMYVLNSFATGVGAPFIAMMNSLFQSIVIRLGLSLLLTVVFDYGFVGLCAAESVSPILPCFIILVFFKKGRWRRENLL